MAKTIDILERTLENEKKNFIGFCKVCEGLSVFLFVFMIAGCIVQAYELMVSLVVGGMWNSTICSAGNLITYTGLTIAFRFSKKIFAMLKKGETPFTYAVADKIKAAALTMTVTGGIGVVLECVAAILCSVGIYSYGELSDLIGGMDVFVIGLVLIALSYIFNYGCKLQQESDETL